MKLKVKDNTVTEIALNKQIYVVDSTLQLLRHLGS